MSRPSKSPGRSCPTHQTETRWTEKEKFLCPSAPLVKAPHFSRLLCRMGLARYSRNYSGCPPMIWSYCEPYKPPNNLVVNVLGLMVMWPQRDHQYIRQNEVKYIWLYTDHFIERRCPLLTAHCLLPKQDGSTQEASTEWSHQLISRHSKRSFFWRRQNFTFEKLAQENGKKYK